MNILENFLKAVEFPSLLEKLSGDCQTQAGKDRLRGLRPVSEAAELGLRLLRTRELEGHSLKRGAPRIPDPQFFKDAFTGALERGEAFSAEELAAFLVFLDQVTGLRQYLSPEVEIPAVFRGWLERLHALPELKSELRSKISDKGEVLDGASPELRLLRGNLRTLRAGVQSFYQSFLQKADEAEALQEKIVTEREGRLVIPVKRDKQNSVPGFIHGMSASGSTLFVEPREIAGENNRVKENLLAQDEEIRKILREATRGLLARQLEISGTLEASAEIDTHAALARFASRFDGQYLMPPSQETEQTRRGPGLTLKGARHPLLALETGAGFREKVVPLDIEFQESVKVILVSGPNAGGKTVALKTLGLACAMARTGLPVLARAESYIPPLTHFDSDMLDGQSLEDHLSTYAAKLKALKRMVDHAGPGCLYLLDELGAGTDPREGGALGLACLEILREKGAFTLANTHQPLLKLLTQEEKGMANAAMMFDEGTGRPTFQLASGIPGRSYALTLARQFGFTEEILERAKSHLPSGESDLSEVLAKLGAEKQGLEKARLEAEKSRDQAKKLEAELLTARRQIRDEAKNIRKAAQVEAEGLLKNTRRQVERLLQGVQAAPAAEPDKLKLKWAQKELGLKLRNLPVTPARRTPEISSLKPGDKIFFKPGQSEAVVLEADDDKWTAVIQMEEGLRLSCKYSDLGTIPPSSGKKRFPPAGTKQGTGPGGALAAEKGKLDLDLRGKLVDQAITLLDKFLDDALLVDLPFVRIIHGKGTGALKEAIHKHLPGSHPEVEFSMAEPAQGGAGVTIIKFRKT